MMPEKDWTVQEVLRFLWRARTRLPFEFGKTPKHIQDAWLILYHCQEKIITECREAAQGNTIEL